MAEVDMEAAMVEAVKAAAAKAAVAVAVAAMAEAVKAAAAQAAVAAAVVAMAEAVMEAVRSPEAFGSSSRYAVSRDSRKHRRSVQSVM